MIRKIRLENFMAHSETEIELGPHMTVLTGPNNTGKSAVVEALRCLAENPTPRHFIRHGAKKARVEVELDDGTRVAWVRGKTSAIYEVLAPDADEPEVFAKLGRGGVPDEIRDLLRLDRVALDSAREDVDVHIGNQRSPVFLLCDPGAGSTLADFFAASSESAHLLSMQKALKTRVREAKRQAQDHRDRMTEHAAGLDRLADLPRLRLELERAGEMKARLDGLERLLPALERRIAERSALETELAVAEARNTALAPLSAPAERLWPVERLDTALVRRGELERNLSCAAKRSTVLADMDVPPQTFDTRTLSSRLDRLRTLDHERSAKNSAAEALKNLSQPPKTNATQGLEACVGEMDRLERAVRRAADRNAACNGLLQPPQLFDETPLARLLGEMDRLQRQHTAKQEHLYARVDGLEKLMRRIEDAVDRAGNCPLCGALMDAARLVGAESGSERAEGSCGCLSGGRTGDGGNATAGCPAEEFGGKNSTGTGGAR